MSAFDVIVLGAGAAGMFCAIEAGKRGRRVLVLDHAKAPGEKIRISGGGRCNFTNLHIAPERFLSDNPRFALSALKRYTQWDFMDRVSRAGIAWHEKTLGQLFCDGSAREIIAMLRADMDAAGVTLVLGAEIAAVTRAQEFHVASSAGAFHAPRLVVATGGKSIPKMGATGLGYALARQFGLGLVETRPGLVPLTFSGEMLEETRALAGLAVPATVRHGKTAFEEGLLFTHRGLSGPSILQISSYWREGEEITVDLAPGGEICDGIGGAKGAGRAGRGADRAGTASARAAGARGCCAGRLVGASGRPDRARAGPVGRRGAKLADSARGQRGLPHRRSHAGRCGHARPGRAQHGGAQCAGSTFHWRGRGCDWLAGWLQFSMGVVIGLGCGAGGLTCPGLF